MAVPLLSHPFRLMPNGQMATLDDMSDTHLAERLALIVAIQPGERPAIPIFGMSDPAFDDLPMAALQSQVAIFQLPVTINNVTKTPLDDARTNYVIEFDVTDPEGDTDDG